MSLSDFKCFNCADFSSLARSGKVIKCRSCQAPARYLRCVECNTNLQGLFLT